MPNVIEELVFAFGYQIDSAALDRASKAADSNAKKTEAAYKHASKEVELAQKRLAAAVGEAAKETAAAALEAATESRDAAKKSLEDMGRDVDKLHSKLGEKLGGIVKGIGIGIAGIGAGAAAAIAGVISHGVDQAKELDAWSKRLGVTTTALQRLELSAASAGIEADTLREAGSQLRENLGELARVGGGPAKEALGSLGLTLSDLEDLSLEDQFGLIGEALNEVQDPAKRTSAMLQLLGTDGAKLWPVISQGTEGLHALGDAAQQTGQIMDEGMIASAKELDKDLRAMKGEAAAAGLVLLDALLPSVKGVSGATKDWVIENDDLIKQDLPEVLRAIGDAAKGLIGIFAGVAGAMRGMRDEISELKNETREGKGVLGWIDSTVNGIAGLERGPSGKLRAKGTGARGRADFDNADLWESTDEFAVGGPGGAAANDARVQAWGTALKAQAQARGGRESQRMDRAEVRISADAKARTAAAGTTGGGGGKSAEQKKAEAELAAAMVELRTLGIEDELRQLGMRSGASAKAIQASYKAAGESYAKGSNAAVAKKAGVGSLSGFVGTDLSKREKDPLMSAIFGSDLLPDVPLSQIEQGQQPQVLIATINNTYNVNMPITIPGAGDPRAVANETVGAMKSVLRDEVSKVSKFSKVTYKR